MEDKSSLAIELTQQDLQRPSKKMAAVKETWSKWLWEKEVDITDIILWFLQVQNFLTCDFFIQDCYHYLSNNGYPELETIFIVRTVKQ